MNRMGILKMWNFNIVSYVTPFVTKNHGTVSEIHTTLQKLSLDMVGCHWLS